jgi:arsenite methyltransferase
MPDQIQFDEDQSRAVEWVYSTPDVVEQRRTTLDALGLQAGERVLDLGCGPGFLAAEMAEQVGASGRVDAVDMSPSMLALAARREHSAGAAPVVLAEGDVTKLPFGDAQFDAAVSTQVFEYVADMPGALAEVRRVLVDGGRLLIIDTDWDSIVWRSTDDERMARVLLAWDDHLAHRDLPRRCRSSCARPATRSRAARSCRCSTSATRPRRTAGATSSSFACTSRGAAT